MEDVCCPEPTGWLYIYNGLIEVENLRRLVAEGTALNLGGGYQRNKIINLSTKIQLCYYIN